VSRIGKRILTIPAGVTVTVSDGKVTAKGPKGELSFDVIASLTVKVDGSELVVERTKEDKKTREMHGTTNAQIQNMMIGVSEGYSKELEIIGVGYRFSLKGNVLVVNAGYSNPKEVEIPSDLTVEVTSNTEIKITGINKQRVGQFAAEVRSIREPEPYKGKGIRYKGENVRRKEVKKASK